jgi:hypothetical protein
MMGQSLLHLPLSVQKTIWSHLLPVRFIAEEAAFVFVKHRLEDNHNNFQFIDWYPIPNDGFLSRSAYHFELTDETSASVIKRAHDLGATLVELHSHDDSLPVKFSHTDFLGFQEFVPHVWWRLKGQPYIAVVVSRSGFDGLVWIQGPDAPQCLNGISVDKTIIKSTGYSYKRRYEYYEKQEI